MNNVQEPTVRETLTVATSRMPWRLVIGLVAGIVVMSIVVVSGQELKHVPPAAPSFVVLHSFAGHPTDGAGPYAGLIRDAAGNLYGTTGYGGAHGSGTVFKLSPGGAEKVLYSFAGFDTDGAGPNSLIRDTAGNFYGTTAIGGNANVAVCDPTTGCGTIFKLSPSGTETLLYTFSDNGNGVYPNGLIQDATGNLYGTANRGGFSDFNSFVCWHPDQVEGCGTVFKLGPAGTFTVLHTFIPPPDGNDGANPSAGLTRDAAGNLYGTTASGGANSTSACSGLNGCGVVFKLSPNGTETVLHSFTGGRDGAVPSASLMRDAAGNLYGTTGYGGAESSACNYFGVPGCGVVFELIRCSSAPSGYEFKVLYRFTGGADGGSPQAGLVQDAAGNLYGTTFEGGAKSSACSYFGTTTTCGVVFKVSPTGTETVLHTFTGADGGNPFASLIQDAAGNLYGTAFEGGASGNGVVFRVAP
jgi:uncharacterized repeat protein (TIGR03803 family)